MVLAPNRKGGFEMNKSKLCITSLVGALVLVSAFTASSGAQKYSDWSTPINLGPTVNSTAMDRAPATHPRSACALGDLCRPVVFVPWCSSNSARLVDVRCGSVFQYKRTG